jgi:hypothetical protein
MSLSIKYSRGNSSKEGEYRLVRSKSGASKSGKIRPAEKESDERNVDAGILIERD